MAVTICLLAVGMVAGSSLMYGAIVGAFAKHAFVGGAVVIGTSENSKYHVPQGHPKILTVFSFPLIREKEF